MTSEKMSVVDSTLPAPTFEFVGDLDDLTMGNTDQVGGPQESSCVSCTCVPCGTNCGTNCSCNLCTG
jgi:hypothetical protein